jgi:CRISPR/Cas system-associated endoribonuclease Cas2
VETKRTIQRISHTSIWFFEKINKIDKPLARLTRGHRDSILIYKIRNEKEDITTEPEEIQKNHQILLQKAILMKTGKSG